MVLGCDNQITMRNHCGQYRKGGKKTVTGTSLDQEEPGGMCRGQGRAGGAGNELGPSTKEAPQEPFQGWSLLPDISDC